ncbi:MAG: DUF512 domain-containing protein [Atopobiaceae bacterium]|nr:DUF512 domain-containing protein [Atopobiaceae bacterium]
MAERADYAPTETPGIGAWVASVEEGSPADCAGIEPGMRILSVNGAELPDIIAWRWETDGAYCELEVLDPHDGLVYGAELYREAGEDWGIEFTDVLFDGVRTCVNGCIFCFMSMLPPDARASLSLRDDDFRLSFLQGNFVTLTNVSDEDVQRIIECRLEPMNVSLHAISPDVRRRLIGKHADRGIEVLEQLMDADIEIHAQIVLCPDLNDGDELEKTLDYIEAHPQITSTALVPVGYTKHQKRFERSYVSDREASRRVVEQLQPYQERARAATGSTRFQLSDEFYLAAGIEVPPAEHYDGYPQFYDGIGMLRSFLDELAECCSERADDIARVTSAFAERDVRAILVCGEAALGVMSSMAAVFGGMMTAQAIRNDYFGGDVNVTGLIVECDLLEQLPANLEGTLVILPEVMFNSDMLTLDGGSFDSIDQAISGRGGDALLAVTTPHCLLDTLLSALEA